MNSLSNIEMKFVKFLWRLMSWYFVIIDAGSDGANNIHY